MSKPVEAAFERWKPCLYGVEYRVEQGGSREYLRKNPALDDFVFGIGCYIREELEKGSEATAMSREVRRLLKKAAEARIKISGGKGGEAMTISKDAEKLMLLEKNAESLVLRIKQMYRDGVSWATAKNRPVCR